MVMRYRIQKWVPISPAEVGDINVKETQGISEKFVFEVGSPIPRSVIVFSYLRHFPAVNNVPFISALIIAMSFSRHVDLYLLTSNSKCTNHKKTTHMENKKYKSLHKITPKYDTGKLFKRRREKR